MTFAVPRAACSNCDRAPLTRARIALTAKGAQTLNLLLGERWIDPHKRRFRFILQRVRIDANHKTRPFFNFLLVAVRTLLNFVLLKS